MTFRVLVLGGYGLFGRRIARRLARDGALRVVVAGRNADAARTLAAEIGADVLARERPQLVINTAGPFPGQDYAVAEAVLRAGAHYVDLADARDYVAGFGALDALARERGLLAVAGASTVPALSAAVVDRYRADFARLTGIDIGISPGNRTERGLATVAAILSYVGRALPWRERGRRVAVRGWQRLRRHVYAAPVGARWLAACDVPDLALFVERYAPLDHLRFRAGLELKRLHFGVWLLSWLVRAGLVRDLPRHAATLKRASEWFLRAGSDAGAMHVALAGVDANGAPRRLTWEIVAADGDGPEIPVTAAVVLATKLAHGTLITRGARPCLDLFTLDECLASLAPYAIRTRVVPGGHDGH